MRLFLNHEDTLRTGVIRMDDVNVADGEVECVS